MWKVAIQVTNYARDWRILAADVADDGSMLVLQSPMIHHVPAGEIGPGDPFLSFPSKVKAREFLQAMVDAAWDMDVRPTGIKDYEAANGAQKAHLEDMRACVSKAFGVILP